MMTSAQVVETSVTVTSYSPSQDYTHPDDHNLPNYAMTPGFKPFTVLQKPGFIDRFVILNLAKKQSFISNQIQTRGNIVTCHMNNKEST